VHDPDHGVGLGHDFGLGHGFGLGRAFGRDLRLLREARSDGFDVYLSHHRLHKAGRRGIDERSDGLGLGRGHGHRMEHPEKTGIWDLERRFETLNIVQKMVLDLKTCDGAHVALKSSSPVRVGHRLDSASFSAHLFASLFGSPSAHLWADSCHKTGHIDCCKPCCCGLEKGHDGCRVEICCRPQEIGFADCFQVLSGESRRKVIESWSRMFPLGCSRRS
jgi:hypothetical protein